MSRSGTLADDLDLAAVVQREGAVGDGLELDSGERAARRDDLLRVSLTASVDHELADDILSVGPDDSDGGDLTADRANRGGDETERLGLVGGRAANRLAVADARLSWHGSPQRGVFAEALPRAAARPSRTRPKRARPTKASKQCR